MTRLLYRGLHLLLPEDSLLVDLDAVMLRTTWLRPVLLVDHLAVEAAVQVPAVT
jgi:hypothetical protein